MKIEEQVLSREQMKHLQSLGVDTSDASLVWFMSPKKNQWKIKVKDNFAHELLRRISPERYIPTYTIGDLIEKLPIRIGSVNRKIYFTGKYIIVSYSSPDGSLIEYRGTTLLCLLYSLLCWVAETHKELLEVKK